MTTEQTERHEAFLFVYEPEPYTNRMSVYGRDSTNELRRTANPVVELRVGRPGLRRAVPQLSKQSKRTDAIRAESFHCIEEFELS